MFHGYDLILKTRRGQELEESELRFLVNGFVDGTVADYQVAAWLMAVCFQGLTPRELNTLTTAMVDSGQTVDLSALPGIAVDKHSTGGVGDTTSLILVPLVAAAGLPVAKMSGRGLGHTGGTLDKLESIPGFSVDLELPRLLAQVNRVGLAIAGQTADLAPADRKLYALRDVTATVDSIPLIASSIMSKKIAGGAGAIVLDVKVGRGAFMETIEQARLLARTMMHIGEQSGRTTRAVLTSMEQPLGLAIGNALEVQEAIETLRGSGPADLRALCVELGALMCLLGQAVNSVEEGRELCTTNLDNGKALEKFRALVAAQGGDTEICSDSSLLPSAPVQLPVQSPRPGWVQSIDALTLGNVAVNLGAGRRKKGDAIDPSTGLVLAAKVGDHVGRGQPLAEVHASSPNAGKRAVEQVLSAVSIAQHPVESPPLIHELVTI